MTGSSSTGSIVPALAYRIQPVMDLVADSVGGGASGGDIDARRPRLGHPESMLIWSDDRLDLALVARDRLRAEIAGWGLSGAVNLVGALSVPGLLTKGDVDLHLCIESDAFEGGVGVLGHRLIPTEQTAWAATLRVFTVPHPVDVPVGLAVTPHDSEHDRRFRLAWRRLRESAALRARYNELKRAQPEGYEAAKSDFFDDLQGQTDSVGPLGGQVCPVDG